MCYEIMFKPLQIVIVFISACVFNIDGFHFKTPTVETENGVIKGTYFTTYNGRIVSAFLGVPFATPPIGELRFHHALPPTSWYGVMHANETKQPCLQFNHLSMVNKEDPIVGTEDCLYLNVYTPKNFMNGNHNLMPVIVFIHGGAFMFGRSDRFNPGYLLDRNDFVFVTIAYRVGPFGFLSAQDHLLPGNNGLKDQVMALKWINTNIKHFGGDADDVTLAGLSAGGASVHFHYFSRMSIGLFKRGISLSGSALCPWAHMSKPKQKSTALAAALGCPTNQTRILLNCLRNRSGRSILLTTKQLFFGWLYNPISPFGPTIEPNNPHPFLTQHPITLLENGQVQDLPWLVGFTTEEGLYPASEFILNQALMQELDETWSEKTPHILNYNFMFENQKFIISKKIRDFYVNTTLDKTSEYVRSVIEMIGDRLYINPIDTAVKLQSIVNRSPVYLYNFAYRGKYSSSNMFTGDTTDIGVSHGDDAAYLLNCYFSCTDNSNDHSMVKTMINMWVDYIRNGTPFINSHVRWQPVNKNHKMVDFLYINSSNSLFMSKSDNLGNNLFWNTLNGFESGIKHDEL